MRLRFCHLIFTVFIKFMTHDGAKITKLTLICFFLTTVVAQTVEIVQISTITDYFHIHTQNSTYEKFQSSNKMI